jgi:hypothetical protein
MAFDWQEIKGRIVVAVIFFFVGLGTMFLALTNRIFGR